MRRKKIQKIDEVEKIIRKHDEKYKNVKVKIAYVILGKYKDPEYVFKALTDIGFKPDFALDVAREVMDDITVVAECHLERAELIADRLKRAGPNLRVAVTVANP